MWEFVKSLFFYDFGSWILFFEYVLLFCYRVLFLNISKITNVNDSTKLSMHIMNFIEKIIIVYSLNIYFVKYNLYMCNILGNLQHCSEDSIFISCISLFQMTIDVQQCMFCIISWNALLIVIRKSSFEIYCFNILQK